MADLRTPFAGSYRTFAAAAAAVASFGLVALGVQLGSNGFDRGGPERNPAASIASPAAAVVDLAPPLGPSAIDPLSLVPSIGLSGPVDTSVSPSDGTAPAPSGAAAPSPGPAARPVAPPATPTPAPAPGLVPDPAPVLVPLGPVVDPILGIVTNTAPTVTGPQAESAPPTTGLPAATPAITDPLLGT